jgi:hypothetical protein
LDSIRKIPLKDGTCNGSTSLTEQYATEVIPRVEKKSKINKEKASSLKGLLSSNC